MAQQTPDHADRERYRELTVGTLSPLPARGPVSNSRTLRVLNAPG